MFEVKNNLQLTILAVVVVLKVPRNFERNSLPEIARKEHSPATSALNNFFVPHPGIKVVRMKDSPSFSFKNCRSRARSRWKFPQLEKIYFYHFSVVFRSRKKLTWFELKPEMLSVRSSEPSFIHFRHFLRSFQSDEFYGPENKIQDRYGRFCLSRKG